MRKPIPRKRFGQNFLQDQSIINQIIQAIQPRSDDTVIEIGPGLGALTRPLLVHLTHLHVVEIDRDIIQHLQATFPSTQLSIHAADALTFDFASLASPPFKIVGNLPYNISTPLLFHLARLSAVVKEMHFMLQKEVVDRMTAEPSTPDYGRLSIMLQYHFSIESLFTVPPSAFWPAPKVQSALVRMIPTPGQHGTANDESLFQKLVMQAFSQRRKTIKNTLKPFANTEELVYCGIAPDCRPETIPVSTYIQLANYLAQRELNV